MNNHSDNIKNELKVWLDEEPDRLVKTGIAGLHLALGVFDRGRYADLLKAMIECFPEYIPIKIMEQLKQSSNRK